MGLELRSHRSDPHQRGKRPRRHDQHQRNARSGFRRHLGNLVGLAGSPHQSRECDHHDELPAGAQQSRPRHRVRERSSRSICGIPELGVVAGDARIDGGAAYRRSHCDSSHSTCAGAGESRRKCSEGEAEVGVGEDSDGRVVRGGQWTSVELVLEHEIFVAPFSKIPALGRFIMRDKGFTMGIGRITEVLKSKFHKLLYVLSQQTIQGCFYCFFEKVMG